MRWHNNAANARVLVPIGRHGWLNTAAPDVRRYSVAVNSESVSAAVDPVDKHESPPTAG
jgi:hypothetical protein